MAAIIEAVAISVSRRPFWPKGALRLADDVVTECLERAHRRPPDLDILINAGVYREKNLAEPALASMIQEDVGANPGHPPKEGSHGTFSFDVSNGGCGVLTALELVDGFAASKTIALGAVVASDSDPGHVAGFPFPNAGGAVLLRAGAAGEGFLSFDSCTFPEFFGCFESVIAWHPAEHPGRFSAAGENVLEITCRDDYGVRAVECAGSAAGRFMAAHGLRAADIDLLVGSAFPADFLHELGRRLEVPASRIAVPDERFLEAHTAGVVASFDAGVRSGRLFAARNVLIVTVGAGITVATALYRHPGAH
ncbi:MAG TPA: 3-oxoacyl-[acyl-carrier-protein] synthase III C-terminal domain-containing protein [Polyangiaceae bacterium]